MNVSCGTPLTAPRVSAGGLCRWKAINKEGRHVGLDFYDLLIEALTGGRGRSTDQAGRNANCQSRHPFGRPQKPSLHKGELWQYLLIKR
jgi:hypothetical protein